MPLSRIIIRNFKSIKLCDISVAQLNLLIGENGTGKTNILEAVNYFYQNLTSTNESQTVFDENNRYSNEVRIALIYDLSEFVKISKTNSGETVFDLFEDEPSIKSKYSGYYKAIISIASGSRDCKLKVEMSQIKGCPIRWNYSYSDRVILKNLFPVFYIDTRSLKVTEWDYIWDILGELGKVSNSERHEIESKIRELLLDQSQEISKKLKGIQGILDAADIAIRPAKPKEFARDLTRVLFSGEMIQQHGKNLNYYSTGTNSAKYIELFLRIVDEMSCVKLKEPIVLLDEPEISLHTRNLDEVAESMIDMRSKSCLMISTHSSRLTKDIIRDSERVFLYSVRLADMYTRVQKMRKFMQYSPTSKYRVTDDHINSYFSKAILFVEGETELELFSNPYLGLLFPQLNKVDVFQAMSQTPLLNIMNPRLIHTQTPYLCLIDMDKAIGYEKSSKKLSLKQEFFRENKKEKVRYRNKNEQVEYLLNQRKRIEAMADKLHIHYYLPFYSCNDPNYEEFIEAIQKYLLCYRVFAFRTTVEGGLINENTCDFALNFLQGKKKDNAFIPFKTYYEQQKKQDRINLLRLIYNGKSDLLQQRKAVIKSLPSAEKDIIENATIGAKTSGWVSDYIDAFIKTATNMGKDTTVREVQRYLEKEEQRQDILRQFKKNFSEIYSLMEIICDMIKE